jgi:hypothetical protein
MLFQIAQDKLHLALEFRHNQGRDNPLASELGKGLGLLEIHLFSTLLLELLAKC